MLTTNEQMFLELVNAARLDPLGEAARQGIGLDTGLSPGTIATAPVQPLAPDAQLQQAASGHGRWMLETGIFDHTGAGGSSPGQRMEAAGYRFEGSWSWGENLAVLYTTGRIDLGAAIRAHHDGLYASPTHRENLFAPQFRETGVSQERGQFRPGADTSMLTHKFGLSGSDVFLTGVIYDDRDGDGAYSVGEGRGGAGIAAAGAATASWAAGGYSLALASDPAVSVTLGGIEVVVDMSRGNVKLDLQDGTRLLTSGDILLGRGAREVELLGAVDSRATGNADDNVFHVGRGDNVLFGLGGTDRAVFTGRRADFDITETGDGRVIVADLRSGPQGDGTNTLEGIEILDFADQSLTLLPAPAAPPEPAPAPPALHLITGTAPLPAGTLLRFTLSDGSERIVATDARGTFRLELPQGLTGHLDPLPGTAGARLPDVGDALDVLRLAVGLAPSFGPATPFDLIAADVDLSGDVSVADALAVLRAAVGLPVGDASPGMALLVDASRLGDAPGGAPGRGADIDPALATTLDLQVITLGDLGASHAL
jgi:hypothetical protein